MGPGMGHCRGPGTPPSGPRRGRMARIRRSAWAAIEIPGYLSPAPSDPLLGLWVRAVRTFPQRSAGRPGSPADLLFSERPKHKPYPRPPPHYRRSRLLVEAGRRWEVEGVTAESDEVVTRLDRGVGLITLNRPRSASGSSPTSVGRSCWPGRRARWDSMPP